MSVLNWKLLEAAQLSTDPFDHLHLLGVLEPAAVRDLPGEFPDIRTSGSFSLRDAPPGPRLTELIDELESDRFRALMSRLFKVDLTGRSTVVTLRGAAARRDGSIHTDSKSKILSLLLYLNEDWTGGEGQLRLLRDPADLESAAVEISAAMGSLVVFRRCDHSWHGHTSYEGPRRVLQFNYVHSERTALFSDLRHRASAFVKKRVSA
jgi:hypothetical protein